MKANNDLTELYLKQQAEDAYQGNVGKVHPNHEEGDKYPDNADNMKPKDEPYKKLTKEQRTDACIQAVDAVGDWLQSDKVASPSTRERRLVRARSLLTQCMRPHVVCVIRCCSCIR